MHDTEGQDGTPEAGAKVAEPAKPLGFYERMHGQRSYWATANAYCETCGAEWRTKNAHGVAVQHARRHRHKVSIEIQQHHTYDGTVIE
jgi:hypothetical protein